MPILVTFIPPRKTTTHRRYLNTVISAFVSFVGIAREMHMRKAILVMSMPLMASAMECAFCEESTPENHPPASSSVKLRQLPESGWIVLSKSSTGEITQYINSDIRTHGPVLDIWTSVLAKTPDKPDLTFNLAIDCKHDSYAVLQLYAGDIVKSPPVRFQKIPAEAEFISDIATRYCQNLPDRRERGQVDAR
jgi:hypothetical protein